VEPEKIQMDPTARVAAYINAPSFLRCKKSGELRPPAPLPPLRVMDFHKNEGGLRMRWEWKKDSPYYTQEGGAYTPPALLLHKKPELKKPVRTALKGGFFK
jgi:hypothetical protein